MKEKKILSALAGLSIYELNSFNKFVHSPYFNVNIQVSDYFDILEKNIKQSELQDLSNESLWNYVYHNEPYNNQRFLKLNSDLIGLLENFIAQQEYESMTSLRACHKLAGAGKRNMTKLYNGILGDIGRLNKYEINQSSEFYLNKYLIEKNIFSLKTENEKKNEKFEIDTELNIQQISTNLDSFYIAEKLKHYCTLLSWKKMYKLDIEMANMENVIALSIIEPFKSIPAVQLFYTIYLTYAEDDNPENYFALKNLIYKYIHIFPKEEQRDIFSTAISYCVNKVNKNISEFHSETFEIYKEALKRDVLLDDKLLPVTDFRNIVPVALRVKEYSWTENFIYEYSQYLDIKYKDNAVEFSLARLEFYRKNFGRVLDHLNRVNYEDVWYNLNAKTLQLAAYYELHEFDVLESFLQSYKMYVRREKSLSPERKIHYLNVIRFTAALMKINAKEQSKVLKLKAEIEHAKGVVSKPWLLEKVEEMIKKR